MLDKVKTLKGYKMHSLDGEIGVVDDFYFDDQYWTVRYLVANTVPWLPGRPVLISPYALGKVDRENRTVNVKLTNLQIVNSPPLDSHKPISRQFEEAYHDYYGWPAYWSGVYAWGPYPYISLDHEQPKRPFLGLKKWDDHLRSMDKVRGHIIQATDGEIGHVSDFIIDDETWAIRYLVIETRNWLPGKHVLVSPKWIERVSWVESNVYVNLSREMIKLSPEYTEDSILTRDYENGLHRHYDRHGYWIEEGEAVKNAR
jgi:hypothetical protein